MECCTAGEVLLLHSRSLIRLKYWVVISDCLFSWAPNTRINPLITVLCAFHTVVGLVTNPVLTEKYDYSSPEASIFHVVLVLEECAVFREMVTGHGQTM